MSDSHKLYQTWCEKVDDPALKADLLAVANDEPEIGDRFYRTLSFGTAGLRGVLGAGTNRMNVYTVGAATQGLCQWLGKKYGDAAVAIAYDSRNNSTLFAQRSAEILAANGIKVHIFDELMPTPALSFAILHLHCQAGIVVTASHNPAKYNGYKVYGPEAYQLSPEEADEVLREIETVDYFSGIKTIPFEEGLRTGVIQYIGKDTVDAYIDAVLSEQVDKDICRQSPISVVYTPLNGAGNHCVRKILDRIGVETVAVVPEQEQPDGDFPTCPYPNPEEATAMELGLRLCERLGYDILLATDPDSDRAGVAVRHQGRIVRLSGNEIGVLMLQYIVERRRETGTLPKDPIVVKSVVSTKLCDRLAGELGVQVIDVLTGFKYIGELVAELEQKGEADRFLLGFEESSGYLTGPHARDKDAVNAAMIICEMTAYYKSKGKTLLDVLDGIYSVCGRYLNVVDSYTFEGEDGSVKMAGMLRALRAGAPSEIGGHAVAATGDYLSGKRVLADGGEETIALPESDILEYTLENGASVIVRPSGTEPKIKVYYSLSAATLEQAQQLYEQISAGVKALLGV
ncbi:phospho-sugar mutase [Harryflintia acetispora]|uniref:phospho-sugar mutase n=1 Tax=Harryflintia acetispora TaxID=1849041 RepID=UPI00189905E1|nr:phospho-sugar mutase [Harryflintia acetispora]